MPPADIAITYDEFRKSGSEAPTETWQEVSKGMYWESGAYSIRISIETWDPNKAFHWDARFEVTKSEEDSIRINIIASMMAACMLPDVQFNFVNPILKDFNAIT